MPPAIPLKSASSSIRGMPAPIQAMRLKANLEFEILTERFFMFTNNYAEKLPKKMLIMSQSYATSLDSSRKSPFHISDRRKPVVRAARRSLTKVIH